MRDANEDFQIKKNNFRHVVDYRKAFSNRMLLVYSIACFLLLGTLNIIFGRPTYTAAITIPLKQPPPEQHQLDQSYSGSFREQQLNYLRSKELLETAEKNLGLQVSYYKTRIFSETELNDDYTPVNVKLIQTGLNTDFQLEIGIYSAEQCEVNFNGDAAIHRFGEKIIENGCEFIIVKTTSRFYYPNITAKITGLTPLTDTYSSLLDASFTPDSTGVKISITLSNAKKAGDLLTELQALYLKGGPDNMPRMADLRATDNQLKKLKTELAGYTKHIDSAEKKQAEKMPADNIKSKASRSSLRKQLNILNVLAGYTKKPTYQFTIIPYTFEVDDHKLRTLLDQLNDSEERRQKLLSANAGAEALTKANQSVTGLRNEVSVKIDSLKKLINSQLIDPEQTPVARQYSDDSSIAKLVNALKEKRQFTSSVYTELLKQKAQLKSKKQADKRPFYNQNKVSIVRNKRSVAGILLISLVAGIFTPMMYIFLTNVIPVNRSPNEKP